MSYIKAGYEGMFFYNSHILNLNLKDATLYSSYITYQGKQFHQWSSFSA